MRCDVKTVRLIKFGFGNESTPAGDTSMRTLIVSVTRSFNMMMR